MANKEFGTKLKILRQKNNLTQKDVYEQLGISQSTFSSWEIGKSEPDAMTFLKLCKIYKVEDILFEFTGESISTEPIEINSMISKLDDIDKAEIRGTVKQMLKSSKYTKSVSSSFYKSPPRQIAALGGKETKTTYKSPRRETT